MKIKITDTMANEYAVRSVYGFISHGPGVYDLSAEQITELKEDAEFYVDPVCGPETTIGERSAYRGLLTQIAKASKTA